MPTTKLYFTPDERPTVTLHGSGWGSRARQGSGSGSAATAFPSGFTTNIRSIWNKQSAPEKQRGCPICSATLAILFFKTSGLYATLAGNVIRTGPAARRRGTVTAASVAIVDLLFDDRFGHRCG